MTGPELIEKIRRLQPKVECHILRRDEEVPQIIPHSDAHDGSLKEKEKIDERSHIHKTENRQPAGGCPRQDGKKKGDDDMTEQELRSLSRKELLEMMIEQGKELEFVKAEYEKDLEFLKTEHEKEITSLKAELEDARKALQKREIAINEAGSIAVAALQVNGVFEAAQAASQQYIENIRSLSDRQASICAKRDADSRAEADRRLGDSGEMRGYGNSLPGKMRGDGGGRKRRSEDYWTEVSTRLQAFYENHQELKKLLNVGLTIPKV